MKLCGLKIQPCSFLCTYFVYLEPFFYLFTPPLAATPSHQRRMRTKKITVVGIGYALIAREYYKSWRLFTQTALSSATFPQLYRAKWAK